MTWDLIAGFAAGAVAAVLAVWAVADASRRVSNILRAEVTR